MGAVAVLLAAMGMVSLGKAVLIDHLVLNCACMGGNANISLGGVSFAEDLTMAAMGAVMLAGRSSALRLWLCVLKAEEPDRSR